ncbi:MAG: hypothetical protein R2856_37870 [Caldilineaceae bacterium]
MYSFDMTSEQKMLVETVHRYAEKVLCPVYREAEEDRSASTNAIRTGWWGCCLHRLTLSSAASASIRR